MMWPTIPWQWCTVWQVKCSLCGIIGMKSTTDSFLFFNFRNSIKVREIFGFIHLWYFVQTDTSIVLECWISSETIYYMIKMINIIINYWSTDVHFFAYLYSELMENNRTQDNRRFFTIFLIICWWRTIPSPCLLLIECHVSFWNKPFHCHISLKYMIWRIINKIVTVSCSLIYTCTNLLFHGISVTSARQTKYIHNSICTLLKIHYVITDIIIHN
jgi:hypothetical protein